MKKIYVVNGQAESGKTLFGQIVAEQLHEKGINFLHTSSIDPVKQILKPYEGWDPKLKENIGSILLTLKKRVTNRDWDGVTKDQYWRKAMSDLKICITEQNPFLIHNLVLDQFEKFETGYVGFVDIREPENIEAFKKHAESMVFGLEVSKILLKSDMSIKYNNRSDLSVDQTQYDIVIENNRQVFVNDDIARWFLKAKVRTFIDQEVLEGRQKERFY